MAVLSTLALRPDAFDIRDLPETYVAEGELFLAFGPPGSKLFEASVPSRRYVHPDHRHASALPDYINPLRPHEVFGVMDDLGDGDYTRDAVEFVLNGYEDADYNSLGGGGYRIKPDWKQRFVDLQQRVVQCCTKIIDELPEDDLVQQAKQLLTPLSDDTWIELIRTFESYDEMADSIFALKMDGRNNLAVLNWLMHTQPSWWRAALDEEEREFIDKLDLPRRPKRGGFINPCSDWSHVNIPMLLQMSVPFAFVWSEATNAQPRFARLDPALITGYYGLRTSLGREPAPKEIPAIANGKREALFFDHLLQDKRARTRGSPTAQYDEHKTYLVQLHEGWRGILLKDPEAIQRSLNRYEHYEKDIGDGKEYVIIEAWSMRNSSNKTVRATYEFGPVATQSRHGQRLGERAELSVDERREMYKLSYAPWGGSKFDVITGEAIEAVPLDHTTALVELERLFYPRSPVLEHSVPPPTTEQHRGDEASTPALVVRVDNEGASPLESARSSAASSLLRRMGGFATGDTTPPPSTHSSWRTETDSDLPFSDSLGRRRSASPRRGVRMPNTPVGLVAPDPARVSRNDVATPGSPLWQQRYTILRSAFPALLGKLSTRPYPRSDNEFFMAKWCWDFLKNGYLRFPVAEDRIRVYIWLETQDINDATDLLRLCLFSGIRFEAAYLTSAQLPEAASEIVGPEPAHYVDDYLHYQDGGPELYRAYVGMVQDLCRLEHAPSFVYHGGLIAAIAAHYGKEQLKGRVGTGVHLATRLYKTGKVIHPYGLSEEIVIEKPTDKEINKLRGLVKGRDGTKLFSLFPPPHLWAEYWPGNGEWNVEEENYFQDIVAGLENGTRTALSESRWIKQLKGRRNALQLEHADRRQLSLPTASARSWVSLFDWIYGVEDGTMKVAALGPGFRARRLPLFR